jgi:hypothetical protein
MEWTALIITTLSLGIGIIGLVWTFLGRRQNEELKRLIVSEKEMIRDRILDIRQTLGSRRDQVISDRETFDDPTRNQVHIRIEDIEGMMENLQRFADRLREVG